MNGPVFVTRPFLPPQETYQRYVTEIFNSRNLTNNGPLARQLEQNLKKFLGLPHLSLCANGTLALQLAIKLLRLNGKKVITTPFTYVATVSALIWENCEPVFADIDPETLCISPAQVKLRLARHPDAAAIMGVHVYGNACDVYGLDDIARANGIPALYDAAHAFGSALDGQSLLAFGAAAACSFHATKIFHTGEGGCVIASSQTQEEKINLLRAFGHIGDNHISPGINAKMSELHAAMGLSILPFFAGNLAKLERLAQIYDETLDISSNSALRRPAVQPGLKWNHAYYPVIFSTQELLKTVMDTLERCDIHPRRYFYPSLTKLPYAPAQSCPVAEDIAQRVLCLPLWPDMEACLAAKTGKLVMEAVNSCHAA